MAESIIKSQGVVKSASFSGTTSASGNVELYNGADRMVIGAKDALSTCYTIWISGNAKYAKAYTTTGDGKFEARANTAVSGTYYYLDS